ncbi:MAG: hypothetical protein IJ060_07925 [Oscillospiraceae bacterium]|nr:hypothetical protein [Oscillospiraceae bacterium]
MTGRYKIADKTAEITSVYDTVHSLCAAYRTDEKADYAVVTTQADIEYEREKSAREDALAGVPVRQYPDSYLEELAVYRRIAVQMLQYDTVLFHGSVIAVDGIGYLFTAKSGTGKSTHSRLWREYFGDRAVMVNDDKPLLHIADTVTAYGTPYNGKHRLGANIAVPLRAVCILTRGAENSIEPVTAEAAYPFLMQQVYRPADPLAMQKTLALTDRLAVRVCLYRLRCNMDISAARVAYEGMQ